MSEQVVRVQVGDGSRRALFDAIRSLKAADPLAPVIVLTPTARAAVHLRRVAATEQFGTGSAGVANVTFVTLDRLAEALGAEDLERSGRRHLTRVALHAACRRVLGENPDLFGAAGEHPSSVLEIVERYEELRVAGEGARRVLASRGRAASALARVALALREVVAPGYYDDVELFESAESSVRRDRGIAVPGDVVVYLPERLRPAEAALLRALAVERRLLVLLGVTGNEGADAPLAEREALLGAPAPAEPPSRREQAASQSPVESAVLESAFPAQLQPLVAARAFDKVLLATDPVAESRAATRLVVEALEAGSAPERVAIVYPRAVPYAGLVAGELRGAGIGWGGPSPMMLVSYPSARALSLLVAMRPERIGRRALVALLGAAPLRAELSRGVRPGEWDRVTRLLGIAEGGIDEWLARTVELMRDASRGVDLLDSPTDPGSSTGSPVPDSPGEPSVPPQASVSSGGASHGRSEAARRTEIASSALIGVLRVLEEVLRAGRQRRGYDELASWAIVALDALFGSEETRATWDGGAGDADRELVTLLVEMASLGDLDGDIDLERFGRVVVSELERPGPSVGRLRSGVVVGSLEQALGLDLDLVIVLGLAEGDLPGRVPTSALLSAADREAAGLEDHRDVEARDLRRVLLACAAGTTAVGTVPRVDPRSGRPATPSRFVAEFHGVAEVPRAEELFALVAGGLVPLGTEELECALVLPYGRAGFGASSHFVARRYLALHRGLVALESRRAEPFGAYTGRVGAHDFSSPRARAVSPTSLESYATCPFRYLVANVLGCEAVEEPERRFTIDPRVRGTIVHEVLESYLREAIAGRHDDFDEPARMLRLAVIGAEVFTRFERHGLTGRRVPSELERRRVLRMLEAERVRDEARRRETGSRPLAVEYVFGFDSVPPVSFTVGEREVAFRGRIDRVDEVPGGLEVLDYKTGRSEPFRGLDDDPVDRGRHLQLPVYALAGAAAYDSAAPRSVRAAFRFLGQNPTEKEFVLDEPGLARFSEAVGTILDGIAEGAFPFHPGELEGPGDTNCRYCDFDALCPRDRFATWQAAAPAPALAAYLALAEPGARA